MGRTIRFPIGPARTTEKNGRKMTTRGHCPVCLDNLLITARKDVVDEDFKSSNIIDEQLGEREMVAYCRLLGEPEEI